MFRAPLACRFRVIPARFPEIPSKNTPRKHFLKTLSGSSRRKELPRAFPRNIFRGALPDTTFKKQFREPFPGSHASITLAKTSPENTARKHRPQMPQESAARKYRWGNPRKNAAENTTRYRIPNRLSGKTARGHCSCSYRTLTKLVEPEFRPIYTQISARLPRVSARVLRAVTLRFPRIAGSNTTRLSRDFPEDPKDFRPSKQNVFAGPPCTFSRMFLTASMQIRVES